ncbi:DNA-processing protein DprA [Jatrophihabitans telluris]|uniref:DNA-processing protein DprA n=1 Tax=Jatrophihabitans telluris TaxID=2038343 RepID=A0ABY4R2Q4_9ACTN|nr:DNA-processing protein DprA [Jatrophihabitans telluris]UQX90010.1 DNA-processing protein DprA [Jatrophihabitans telluris]
MDETLLVAAAYLSRVAEPANLAVYEFVTEYGLAEAARLIRRGDVPEPVARATDARRAHADPEVDLAAAARNEIRLITADDPAWPHFAFSALHGATNRYRRRRAASSTATEEQRFACVPPLALWLKGAGDLQTAGLHSAAIVGSRASTAYGNQVAAELAYALGRRDITVVSGGAFGIDAAAHRGVLAAEGPSVLVSAAGLDRPYPSGNAALYDRTAELGVLVSERPPGSAPFRQRFLSRNRLIAALGTVTVVVEAARRSGALNTARHARTLGRRVLAVPGPITSTMSTGCHELLAREEHPAGVVISVDDVVRSCGSMNASQPERPDSSALTGESGRFGATGAIGVRRGEAGGAALGQSDRRGALGEVEIDLLEGFPPTDVVTEAELSYLSGVPMMFVAAGLRALTDCGLVLQTSTGFRLVPQADRGSDG